MKFLLLLSICSLLLYAGCSDDTVTEPVDFGFEFFPLSVGNFREYSVVEVNFLTAGPDTSRFFLREEITDSIVNGEQINYILERSVRESMIDPWVVDSVWTTRIDGFEAIQVENNVPFVKIEFPISEGNQWDANAFNNRREDLYTATFITTDSIETVLEVVITDIEPNIVLQDQRSEFYARGIGLIRRDFVNVSFCQSNCNFVGEILSGRVLDQRLIRHGEN